MDWEGGALEEATWVPIIGNIHTVTANDKVHLVQQSPQFEEVLVWRCLASMSSMRLRRNRGVWMLPRLTLQSLHVSAPFPSQAGRCLLRFVRVCNGMHHHTCTSEHTT